MAGKRTALVGIAIIAVVIVAVAAYYYLILPPPLEKVTLRILMHDYDMAPGMPLVAEAYNEHTDGRVEVIVDQFPYEALHEKIVAEMTAESSTYDILCTDGEWAGELHGNSWIVAITDIKRANPDLPDINWDIFFDDALTKCYISPAFVDVMEMVGIEVDRGEYGVYDGKMWALPGSYISQTLTYRKDLFEKYNVKVPTNWDEYLEAAEKLTIDEDGDGEIDVYGGILLMGAEITAYNEFSFRIGGMGPRRDVAPKLTEAGFGFFFSDDLEPTFNDERGVKSLEHVKALKPYAPPGTMSYWWPELALYTEGKIAMVTIWWDCFPFLEDPEHSQVAGLNGYTVVPYDVEQWSWGGGWPYWITKFSNNKEEAYRFLAWMSEGEAYWIIERSGPGAGLGPPGPEWIADPEVLEYHPNLEIWPDLKGHLANYPTYLPEWPEIYRILGEECSSALLEEKTVKEALDAAAQRIHDVLEEHGRYE